jgi:hypothetical protein
MIDIQAAVARAVRAFWRTRRRQHTRQGATTGKRDYGSRGAVTGGAQMDGFISLVRGLLKDAGLPKDAVFHKREVVLPGFFRPTKAWDLLVVSAGHLVAAVEFKSQVGPAFGNNYNNRTEEALGSATDLWTAYREGAFRQSPRPWVGYLMFLEEAPGSTRPVGVDEPHFPVLNEFRDTSYAGRYELLCQKLVRERLYDSACLILSDSQRGPLGEYREPCFELGFPMFAASLTARAATYAKLCGRQSGGD